MNSIFFARPKIGLSLFFTPKIAHVSARTHAQIFLHRLRHLLFWDDESREIRQKYFLPTLAKN